MLTCFGLPVLMCASLMPGYGPSGDAKELAEQIAEVKITLRLNAIQTTKLLGQYERLFQREMDLQNSVRSIDPMDTRLPQYQRSLQDTQADLVAVKKKLIAVEVENVKLAKRLPRQDQAEETLKPAERADRVLEKILERLESIEKRLEKIERRTGQADW
jgi:hypothetical protein